MHPIAGDGAIDQSSRSGSLLLEERIVSEENASLVISNPFLALSIQQQRSRLPIFKYRSHILYLLEKFRAVIVIGETGCGKSTQLPQYLMEAGWSSDGRKIGVTQPRRIAAVTKSNIALGTFCSILMIDEAHERSLNTDVILGLLRKVMAVRQDLRIIVSSATLDAVVSSIFHLCL
ncbi:unnamed protein product [Gongylonema pulchrum]|uniref:Helicase ATP-binding domain-containing protein n=1 Tax=Gongylonema pulchrum TaxID=637853 RepID=A0A183EAH9_9BILA|nr:unnamed protein product [Gongylonema pulchrum]